MATKAGRNDSVPIIVKKVTIVQANHRGAWKVAYADFVTAMMADFLLLGLLGGTTEDQAMASPTILPRLWSRPRSRAPAPKVCWAGRR